MSSDIPGPGASWLAGRRWSDGVFTLLELAADDLEVVRTWRNSQTDVLRQNREIAPAEQRRWFETVVVPTHESPTPSFLLVGMHREGHLVAYGGLTNLSWDYRRAEVSFLADTRIASDNTAYAEVLDHFLAWLDAVSFDDLSLHRLFTETYAYRIFHITLLERHGYRLEGRLREHVVKRGKRVDSLMHGRLATER